MKRALAFLARLESLPLISLIFLFEALVLAHLVHSRFSLTFLNNWAVPGDPRAVRACVLVGLWSTGFGLLLISCALSFLPRRLGKALWAGFIALLGLQLSYRYARGASIDFALLSYNLGLLRDLSSWEVIGAVVGYPALFCMAPLLLLAAFFKRFELFALPSRVDARARLALIAACAVLILRYNRSLASADQTDSSDVYFLGRSLLELRSSSFGIDRVALSRALKSPYPLLRQDLPSGPAVTPKPNIIIVFLESFPGEDVGHRLPDGRSLTPSLDRLKSESLWVKRFYSNSIQTAPAYTSTHCGLIPSVKKIQTDYQGDSFRCLPSILSDAGYETVLYYPMDPAFDNMREFFGRNGFREIVSLAGPLPDPRCSARVVQGLRDDCIFDNVLADLDRRHLSGSLTSKRPIYASLLTTVTHIPFTYPDGFPKPIAAPVSPAEDQMNVASFSDRFLGDFLTRLEARPYLKNTIVVVVGDHSIAASTQPRGRVQSGNEVGLTQRHVWVPFCLYWPGHIAPREIADATYSQIDIAPTILDLLKIRAPNSFVGRSILADDRSNIAPIVQPYSGEIFGAIRFPYFYRLERRGQTEELSRLDDGDGWEREVPLRSIDPETLAALRGKVQEIFLNERLLSGDRVFPRAAPQRPEDVVSFAAPRQP